MARATFFLVLSFLSLFLSTVLAQTPECGPNAPCGPPYNACCSKNGTCGATTEFCSKDQGCQSGCDAVVRPTCPLSQWQQRRVAYYQIQAGRRDCNRFNPEDIPVHALTHVYIGYAAIGTDFKIGPLDEVLIRRMTKLKLQNKALEIYMSIIDPGPAATGLKTGSGSIFAAMVAKTTSTSDDANIDTFIASIVDMMTKYGLDGVDIDWEWPGATNLELSDFVQYGYFINKMRTAFDAREPRWGISVTLPATYDYLKHFDVEGLQKSVKWFNLKTYDIHGKRNDVNEPARTTTIGHSTLTDINIALDSLLRAKVNLKNVNLGMGFHGRTYTLNDPTCLEPGCKFDDAGLPGDCSAEAGMLTYREIIQGTKRLNKQQVFYEDTTGTEYMVYDEDQWITYDDQKSYEDKRKLLDSRCLGGVAIFSIDEDTQDFQALSYLLGDGFVTDALIEGGTQSDGEKSALALELGGLTGDGCYVTLGCSDATGEKSNFGSCKSGYVPTERLHQPGGSIYNNYGLLWQEASVCPTGQWHTVCCKRESPPQNCVWRGAPAPNSLDCKGGEANTTCGGAQYELMTDVWLDSDGAARCATGLRSLCCDNVPEVQKCRWTGCSRTPDCYIDTEQGVAIRGDRDGGIPCADGEYRNYCCQKASVAAGGPRADRYKNCQWQPPVPVIAQIETTQPFATLQQCTTNLDCASTQITMTKSKMPNRYPPQTKFCKFQAELLQHRLCCDPPRNVELPFNPNDLFEDAHNGDDLYIYKDNFGNTDKDPHPNDEQDFGEDPYGFILLDGAEDALQGSFPRNFVFVHDDDNSGRPLKRRGTLMTEEPHILGSTFDHEESWHYVYCNKGMEVHCDQVFLDGAQDTIIGLPGHIGSGPYARIVSMDPVDEAALPNYHLGKRALQREHSTVYKLIFDYNFDLIKRGTPVNVRMDYTNMANYWDMMTGLKSGQGSGVSRRDLERRKADIQHAKRYWAEFKDWLKKLNSVELEGMGKLPMQIKKEILLYRYRVGCPRGKSILKAGLDITLNTDLDMNARWAYYVTGTIVPLDIHRTYAYFGVQPTAQLTVKMKGSAQMRYNSKRVKIIDTLAWPGLAIKGIASIGPTLDLYAEMRSQITISGEIRAGARVDFPAYEIFFPQNDESEEFQKWLEPNSQKEQESGLSPILDASVQASVGLDLLITPEVNLGISVGLKSGIKVVDAQIVAFVNNTLSFNIEAEASGSISNGGSASASYKIWVDYFYNFGIGGRATFISFIQTALKPRTLWPGKGKQIRLWEHQGSVSTGTPPRSIPAYSYWNDTAGEPMDEYNDYFRTEDANVETSGVLAKRLNFKDISSFGKGLITCNDDKQCSSGGCNGDVCTFPNTQPQSKKRDDGTDSKVDSDNNSGCLTDKPAFMYNCKYFPDKTAPYNQGGVNAQKEFKGICSNIESYLDGVLGVSGGPMELTHASTPGLETNRGQTCGKKTGKRKLNGDTETWSAMCQRLSDEFHALAKPGASAIMPKGNQNWMSCDEFPFNSVEEGGTPQGALACVAGDQQEIQGQANTLLGYISQNIDVAGVSTWRAWGSNWDPLKGVSSKSKKGQPKPPPVFDGVWNVGGLHKKKFTFHLFSSSQTTGVPSTVNDYTIFEHTISKDADPKIQNLVTDIDKVIAAINLGGNPNYKMTSNFNAKCDMGTERGHKAWTKFPNPTSCTVKFETPDQVKTRKRATPDSPDEAQIISVELPKIEDLDENHENHIRADDPFLSESMEGNEIEGSRSLRDSKELFSDMFHERASG